MIEVRSVKKTEQYFSSFPKKQRSKLSPPSLRQTGAALLAVGMVLASPLCTTASEEPAQAAAPPESISYLSGGNTMAGVVIESSHNREYPSSANLGYWSLLPEAEQISETAVELGMDTLFYEVTPQMASMYHSLHLPQSQYLCGETGKYSLKDPLKMLVKAANEDGLSVCAVVSPFDLGPIDYNRQHKTLAATHPDLVQSTRTSLYLDPSRTEVHELIAKVAEELSGSYKLNGVVIDLSTCIERNGASIENLQSLMNTVSRAVRKKSGTIRLGIILPGNLLTSEEAQATQDWIQTLRENQTVDFIMPAIEESVSGQNAYADTLDLWVQAVADASELEIFSYNQADRIRAPLAESSYYADEEEMLFQQFTNSFHGAGGSVISSLRRIVLSPSLHEGMGTVQNSSRWYIDPALICPQTLTIGNPENAVSTNRSSFLITGVCDPDQPLYLNEELYTGRYGNITEAGYFALEVPLKSGSNQFVFSQGNKSRVVTITRTPLASRNNSQPIEEIVQESAFPINSEMISVGNPVTLSCIAPAGAQLTAIVDGQEYPLTQENHNLRKGRPAKYSARLSLGEPENMQIQNLGSVSYSMVYNGSISYQNSLGELIHVGSQELLTVEVTDPLAPVYANSSGETILHTLIQGTRDYVTADTDDFFYLSSGGCINKNAVEILTKQSDIYNISKKISNVVVQSTNRGEYITFAGGGSLPCTVKFDPDERTVTLHLFHVLDIPQNLSYLDSDMFEDIKIKRTNNDASVVLTLREQMPFYGYHLSVNENNLIVYFRSHLTEQASDASRLLSDVNIVIDAGHGGRDTGTQSLLSSQGPDEESLNLALANALADRLHSLGANVFMTRSNHQAMAGLDRIMFSLYREADLLISLHHCQSEEGGIAVRYNENFSQQLAQQIADGLQARMQRPVSPPVQDTSSYLGEYSISPAVSVSPGSLMEPDDYAAVSDPVEIYRCAYQIAQEVQKFLLQTAQEYEAVVEQKDALPSSSN